MAGVRRRRRGLLGDPNDITTHTVTDAQKVAWFNIIGQWESLAAQFETAYQDLLGQADFVSQQSDPQVQTDYNALVTEGSNTYTTIQNIQTALADVKNALAGAWSAVTGVWSSLAKFFSSTAANASQAFTTAAAEAPPDAFATAASFGLMGLGQLVVLIPIAVVAAAIAAVTAFLTHHSEFNQRMSAYKQAAAAGATPTQLSTLAQQLGFGTSGGGVTSTLGSMVMVAAVIAGLVFLPRLIGSYRSALR